MRRLTLMMTLLGSLTGCATGTGRSATESVDDAFTTAAVKTRLAQEKFSTLTRVDVDTYQGIVSLNGVVDDEVARGRAGEAARHVGGVRAVINNLRVQSVASSPAPVVTPPPVVTAPIAVPPVVLDRENRWRRADSTIEGNLSEIRRRATREAALQNRPVAYESIDGFHRVEAYPTGAIGAAGCRQVRANLPERPARPGPGHRSLRLDRIEIPEEPRGPKARGFPPARLHYWWRAPPSTGSFRRSTR